MSAMFPVQWQARRVVFLAVLAVLFQTVSTGYSFTAVYAFGDSLTDTGRNPPTGTNYYNGRYSNGPLWIEYLSAMLGIAYNASNNLAVSGSTTYNLSSQIASMPASSNPQSALFTLWSGPNDFLDAFETNLENNAAWGVTVTNTVLNITNAVATLYSSGAREVLVGNMPNIGQTPGAASYGSTLDNYIDTKVQLFNSALSPAVTNLMLGHPGLRVYLMNANQEATTVYDSPATYGFTVISIGALQDTTLTNKSFNGPGADYLFWDPIHPTTKMHAMIGTLAYDLVGVGLNLAGSAPNVSLSVSNLYPGFQYSIQGSTNLVTWTNYETFTATSTNLSLAVPMGPGPAAFYRVVY